MRKFVPLVLLFFLVMISLSVSTSVLAKTSLSTSVDRHLRNIMVVHFYGAKTADIWRWGDLKSIIPEDPDAKITVQPIVPYSKLGKSLECHQFRTRSYRDWEIEKTYDKNGYPNSAPLGIWRLPAYRKVTTSRKYWYFDDWPVHVSMAVFGDTFEMAHILDEWGYNFSDETLRKTHELHEHRFEIYTENFLYRRPIIVLTRKQCDGFRIFDFEVREHG